MNLSQEAEFGAVLRAKAEQASRELAYQPQYFYNMLDTMGPYATVTRPLSRREPSDGFKLLWEKQRLDLSVEAVVVESAWRSHFDPQLVHNAERLLAGCFYHFRRYQEPSHETREAEADAHEASLMGRTDIAPAVRAQLLRARRGQGQFRDNVVRLEAACRITGVSGLEHLRASHIKPWRDCSDQEKLDGGNGLLLAPHVEHLFARGYITFKAGGDMLVSSQVDLDVLASWGIPLARNVGAFSPQQAAYLAWHFERVFKP